MSGKKDSQVTVCFVGYTYLLSWVYPEIWRMSGKKDSQVIACFVGYTYFHRYISKFGERVENRIAK